MSAIWPEGFPRVPDEDWTRLDPGDLARKYDTVENHGWYSNLDRSVEQLAKVLGPRSILLDYSGGTGILASKLIQSMGDQAPHILIVDSSPRFLRLALEKFRDEPRLGFRLIRYLKPEKRLQLLDEVLEDSLRQRGVEAIASTNAIHLYYDLPDTLNAWREALAPGGRVFVQSGNIANPKQSADEWIIDDTVHAIHEAAIELVRRDERWESYRPVLDEGEKMAAYDKLRNKFFLPVRPLSFYTEALEAAGFVDQEVSSLRIEARVDDWYDFLSAYHEGVLGWVGGSRRVEGAEPSEAAVTDRLALIRSAMGRIFQGKALFPCRWTYLTGASPR